MGCSCNKTNREAARIPTKIPSSLNFNSTPQKITNTVPNAAMQAKASFVEGVKANVQSKYMNPERLRIEKIRRDAIRNALGKQ